MPAFHHILVPLDGSRLAEVVLPAALPFAAHIGARVTLLHVLERGAPQMVHGEPHLTDARAAEEYLRLTAARHAIEGLAVDVHVHAVKEDDVARGIVEHTRELDADLTALTPHGRGGLRRWLIGSIAQQVLQLGETPVLLVPPPGPQAPPPFDVQSILVPLNGEEAAEVVLPIALEIARTWHARVSLVQAVPTLATLGGNRAASARLTPLAASSALEIERQGAQDYLGGLEKGWPADVSITIEVLRGDPAEAIVDLLRRAQPDLVVLSTHGRAGLAGLWAASVAPRIIAHAVQPILMVRIMQPRTG
jgi:nucleotide-binding universal stress UspA family protein